MKKIVPCLLALILLLSACHHESQMPFIPDTGDNPQQGAVQNPDKNPNDKDTDTDNKEDQEQDQEREKEELQRLAACLLTERKTLSYAEFFSEDRMYALDGGHGRYDWAVVSEDGMRLFEATRRLNAKEYCVTSYDCGEKYNIPGTSAYVKDYEMFSADGVYAYFKNSKEIVQLEMRTGTARQIVQSDYISDAYICGRDALYYAAVKDGKLAVNRLYIPTMQLDVLYDDFPANTPVGPREFYLYTPKSTQGDVVWQTINPAMLAQMQKELENPNSKYRVAQQWQIDITSLWEKEDPWEQKDEADENEILRLTLCERIQKDTGIRAYLEGTYNQSSGSYTERLGIIDSCWNGGGHPVDHYAPEITEKEDPVPAFGEWIHIPDVTPIQDEGGEAKA